MCVWGSEICETDGESRKHGKDLLPKTVAREKTSHIGSLKNKFKRIRGQGSQVHQKSEAHSLPVA